MANSLLNKGDWLRADRVSTLRNMMVVRCLSPFFNRLLTIIIGNGVRWDL
jgi:hypothetical protein